MMDLGTVLGLGGKSGGGSMEWGMGGEEGKSRDSQVACGREWRSRGCRRLPTAGEVGEGKMLDYYKALGVAIVDSVTSSRPEA